MNENTMDIAPDFPINQQLLEDATQAREEWRVVSDRLAKIDESKNQVQPKVYEKVRKDYESRLKKATEDLLKKKELVDHEIKALGETKKKIGAQLETHQHKLEEIKFRNTLGEFTEEAYQTEAKIEQEKISKFETVINAVENNIARYESIFAGEAALFEAQGPALHEEEEVSAGEPEVSESSHEMEPLTDAKGFVVEEEEEEEGGDYFAAGTTDAPTDMDGTSPGIDTSTTSKEPADLSTPKRASDSRPARLVMISGDNAGAAYPIKGTVSIGRADSNTIAMKDSKVSRQHAQIQQQGTEYIIVDLNSSNGTIVNGQKIEEHVLSNGDEIVIGDFVIQFQI